MCLTASPENPRYALWIRKGRFHWPLSKNIDGALWKVVERILLARTDGVIVLNESDRQWLLRNFPAERTKYLPLGIGVPIEAYPRAELLSTNRLVWIGEFSHRKRPELAVAVMQLLHQRNPDVCLTMLGQGDLLQEISEKVEKLGLSSRISLPGRSSVQPVLNSSTALLHTATWEGLPRVALEAIAMGRPVVSFPVKGLLGVPGVTTSESEDPADLAQLADKVLQRPQDYVPKVDPMEIDARATSREIVTFVEEIVHQRCR